MRFIRLSAVSVSFYLIAITATAQVVAGPMPGQVELRTAKIWVEVKPGNTVELWYWKKGHLSSAQKQSAATDAAQWFAPVVFDLVGLEINATNEHQVLTNNRANKKPTAPNREFTA